MLAFSKLSRKRNKKKTGHHINILKLGGKITLPGLFPLRSMRNLIKQSRVRKIHR
jgi:hypothetical protein